MVSELVLVALIAGASGAGGSIFVAIYTARETRTTEVQKAQEARMTEIQKIHEEALASQKVTTLIDVYSALIDCYQTVYTRFESYEQMEDRYDAYVANCDRLKDLFLTKHEKGSIFLSFEDEQEIDKLYTMIKERVKALEEADQESRKELVESEFEETVESRAKEARKILKEAIRNPESSTDR